jgi:hypothetical protein
MIDPRIYLASRSPRRRELLAQVGVRFDLLLFRVPPREDAEVNEDWQPGEIPEAYVQRVARAKAEFGADLIARRAIVARPVLAADTTLDLDGDMTEQFLINFTPQETRVALLQQGVVQELHIERSSRAASSATSTSAAWCACCPACSRPSSKSASSAPPSCTWPTSGSSARTATAARTEADRAILSEGQS